MNLKITCRECKQKIKISKWNFDEYGTSSNVTCDCRFTKGVPFTQGVPDNDDFIYVETLFKSLPSKWVIEITNEKAEFIERLREND